MEGFNTALKEELLSREVITALWSETVRNQQQEKASDKEFFSELWAAFEGYSVGCVTNDQLKHSERYRHEASLVLTQRPEDVALGRNFSPAFQIAQPSAGCWERWQSACAAVNTEQRQLKVKCELEEFLPGVLVRQKSLRENSTCFCGLASSLCLMHAGAALYRRLKEYLMTEEQLKENGYPMPHPEKPGRAVLFTAEEKKSTDCKLGCFILQSLLCLSWREMPVLSAARLFVSRCSALSMELPLPVLPCVVQLFSQCGFRIFHLDKLRPCCDGGEEKLLISTW